jgi:hypothetical protein
MLDVVRAVRGSLDGFDVIVNPSEKIPYATLADRGATWAITGPAPGDDGTLEMASSPPEKAFGTR